MTLSEFAGNNAAQSIFVHAMTSAWHNRTQLFDPSVWLQRDPEAEEKMLRDADIMHAIGFRSTAIAGKTWNLTPKIERSPRSPLAVSVGTELLKQIERFSTARHALARAFFSGSRFARIHGEPRVLTLGDGLPRTWWVPTRLEDIDKRMYRIVPRLEEGCAFWERWSMQENRFIPETIEDAAITIRHIYQDDQATLGYGHALREALGWWWYAKTHVFQETLQAVDRFAQGITTAKVAGARDAETGLPNKELIRQWQRVLEDLRSRNVLVYDEVDQIEQMQMNSEGWQLLGEVRQELRSTIFTLVLGANLTTAANEGGSYALAEIQENSTEQIVQYDREAMEETLTKDLVGCVWKKNHANLVQLGIADEQPLFTITQEKRQDPKERADVATAANQMGLELSKDQLYEQFGFRRPEAGEEILEPAPPPQPAFPPMGGGFGGGGFGGPPQPPQQPQGVQPPQQPQAPQRQPQFQ